MKIRNGYVSNSSSSSFIIKYKDLDLITRICGEDISIQNFIDLITNSISNETYLDTTDNEEIVDFLNDEIEYCNDKSFVEEIRRLQKEILETKDYKFAKINISTHATAIRFLFNLLKKYESLEVKYRCEE